MKYQYSCVLSLALCICSTTYAQQSAEKSSPQAPKRTTSYWMKAKMDYSSNILAAMATGEFDKVEKNADQMLKLGKVEGFIRKNNEDYRKQLKQFERILKRLKADSKKQDIEAVAKQFGQLTYSCVRCHQVLRKIEKSNPN